MKTLSQFISESLTSELKNVENVIDEKPDFGYNVHQERGYNISDKLDIKMPALFHKSSSSILIAAPHHSNDSNDEKTMMSPRGSYRSYDRNTGFIALNIAKSLGSGYLIFNLAPDDPNKYQTNDYCKSVKSSKPSLLVEIHGHSGKSVDENIIEISGGLYNNKMSIKFANLLEEELIKTGMSNIKCIGDFNEIFYKASKTLTVNGNVHNSGSHRTLHIELPPHLRKLGMVGKMSKIITSVIKQVT